MFDFLKHFQKEQSLFHFNTFDENETLQFLKIYIKLWSENRWLDISLINFIQAEPLVPSSAV